ncbi:MAG: Fis family transcriptional regulator [Arcobacter sp.]|nr:MAG: Fis family transcriptional regulator [Arcobacter sp.]
MQEYIAVSKSSKEILNLANLLKNLEVNALISGDLGVGKKSLAHYILPKAKNFDAKELQQEIVIHPLGIKKSSIIVNKIENITNIDLFIQWTKNNHIRVIATSLKKELNPRIMELFSTKIELPPFSQRKEDIQALALKFSKEASKTLDMKQLPQSRLILNISNNAHSLKKSIFFSYLFETIKEDEIFMIMQKYMEAKIQEESSYKKLLHLFEVPLLNLAKRKYKSQVKMAKYLGLNRITLRKKIEQHKGYLDD